MDCPLLDIEADINQNKRPPVFKAYDDGYLVRGMMPADAKIVQRWYSDMGMISPYDLDIILAVFPPGPGCYIGEYQGEVVASAVRLPWGNGAYYGSYYYVEEKYRSRGFGTRLRDEVAFGHVGDNILCVDAVMGAVARKNAAKFGYTEAFVTRRYESEARSSYDVECSQTIVTVDQVPFQKMIDYDNINFISKDNPERRKFLEKMFQISDGVTYVATDSVGDVVGYGIRRPAVSYQPKQHLIGPLYANTAEIARGLLQALSRGVAGQTVGLNVWTPNEASVKMVEEFGFTKMFDVLRMHVNGDPKEFKETVFCPTSIDTCGF